MNREIKFRAWDNVNKRMGYFAPGFQWLDEYDVWHLTEADGNPNSSITDVPFGDNINLMQYTGLKDKNGKEIYEGDIVQLYRHDDYKKYTYKHEKAEVWADGRYQPDIKEVKFMYGSFVIWSDLVMDYRCFANLARPGESLEVIGNVFENPELIKENVSAQ